MPQEATKKVVNLGDSIELSFNGENFKGKVVGTTIVNFLREYCVEFEDGSKRWFRGSAFESLKN